MSFAIKQGLFKLNITDHHAILGVSLDADAKQIRLQYLKIAQKLHPDKCRSEPAKARTAGQILSKLVNPAYEQLSRKTAFAEHQLVLTQIGKRLAENKDKIGIKSKLAQELLTAGGSVELIYPKLLKKLNVDIYKNLAQSGELIEALSELNLVYLMLKSDRGVSRSPIKPPADRAKPSREAAGQSRATVAQAASSPKNKVKTRPAAPPEEPTTDSRVNAFVSRAQQYISRAEFDRAIKELKDALRINPNHGIAHAVMGRAYLHKKQLTMARIHIDKAFKAEPHNQIVMDSKKALDKLSRVASKSKASNPGTDAKSTDKNNKPGNSSFFSGFFGTKKK
ncbi:MAG: DnaJ domain-containing protein [Cyanobacteria bacterium J06631_6]